MIHDLRRQGLGIAAIARQTGLDRKTVRKYLDKGLEGPGTAPASRGRGCWSPTRTISAAASPTIRSCRAGA